MGDDAKIDLRPVTAEDRDFLLRIYATTRAQELAQVPWTDEQKNAFLQMQFEAQDIDYHKRYPQGDFKVITLGGEAIGRIYLHRGDDRIHILDVTLLPEHRNSGIGSSLLRDVVNEAAHSQRNVCIYVETFNPSLRLFQRLGFVVAREEGFNLLLEWRPSE